MLKGRLGLYLLQLASAGCLAFLTAALFAAYWDYRDAGTAGSNGMALAVVLVLGLLLQLGVVVTVALVGRRRLWSARRTLVVGAGIGAVVLLLLLLGEGARLVDYPGDGPSSWLGFLAYLFG